MGPILEVRLSLEDVRAAAAKFLGPIEQMPPPFSAKKIAGVPAYKLARKKKEVPLQAVKVEIRELEILGLIAEGLSNKETAVRLGLGVRTIETHRERIMRKLDIHTVAGLTRFAITHRLVTLE